MAVVDEPVRHGPVVAQPVARLQAGLRLPGAGRRLHPLDRRRRHHLDARRPAAVEVELHVGRHVGRRRVDRAGGPDQDVPVRERRPAVAVVERRDRHAMRRQVGRRLHADRPEQVPRDVVLEALAADLLDDRAGHSQSRVAVGHPRSRPPARRPRVVVVVEPLAQAHAGGVLRVLAQVHVVPAGGVLEQVDDPHRIRLLPRVLEPDVRHEPANRVLQRQLAFVDQLQQRERGEGLGRRADAEQRRGGGGRVRGDVGEADAVDPLGAVAVDDRDRHAGDVVLAQDGLELRPQLRDRAGRGRGRQGGFRRGTRHGQQQHERTQDSVHRLAPSRQANRAGGHCAAGGGSAKSRNAFSARQATDRWLSPS